MYPILFDWHGYVIPSWHFFFFFAAICGWITLIYWRPTVWPEADSGSVDGLFIWTYLAGYLGARGFSILVESEAEDWLTRLGMLAELGGMTLYGGVIAAGLVAMLYARRKGLTVMRLADFIVPSTLLGIAIGRIGCFLNGDDFGIAVTHQNSPPPWAVIFPNLEDKLYRYPIQLAETFFCLAVALSLWSKKSWSKIPGRIGSTGIFAYAAIRFCLEFYRDDERGSLLIDGLSPAQVISLVIISGWSGLLAWQNFKSKQDLTRSKVTE